MDFNDFDKQEEISMSIEEEKTHKRLFSRICLAFLTYILLSQSLVILASFAFPDLFKSQTFSLILSSAIQYLLAFPVFYWMIKKVPAASPVRSTITAREFIKYTAVATFFMYVGNNISLAIMTSVEEQFGSMPENSVETILTENNHILSLVLVGIIAPIIEELIFRKLLIDRTTPYGEKTAVFFSALVFGLLHGNLYQFFYAFLIGLILSIVYVKTGKIIYSTVIHCFINIFFGVFSSYLLSLLDIDQILEYAQQGMIPEEYIEANMTPLLIYCGYILVFYALIFVGLFSLNRMFFTLRFQKGKVLLPKGKSLEIIFFNPGAIALISVCIALMAISTFTFALA